MRTVELVVNNENSTQVTPAELKLRLLYPATIRGGIEFGEKFGAGRAVNTIACHHDARRVRGLPQLQGSTPPSQPDEQDEETRKHGDEERSQDVFDVVICGGSRSRNAIFTKPSPQELVVCHTLQ